MKRRHLLTAASMNVIFASGCITQGNSNESQPDSLSPSDPSSQNHTVLEEHDPSHTHIDIRLGDQEKITDPKNNRPHSVAIWNAISTDLGMDLEVVKEKEEAAILSGTYRIPGDAALSVTLLEPSEYQILIKTATTDDQKVLEVPREQFDCNVSSTQVSVFEDGHVESMLISTTMECD